jgi:hypothetical protein
MPVDFFHTPCVNIIGNCQHGAVQCLQGISSPTFGISDANGSLGGPAIVDMLNPHLWDFEVINNSGVLITFKAIDWCVNIYRTGVYDLNDDHRIPALFSSNDVGVQIIKRCEGFFQFNAQILFLEIKTNQTGRGGWIKDAREKFEETILSFREHHPTLANQILEPILSNPSFHGLHQNEMIQQRILKDKVGLKFKRQRSLTI